MEKTIDIFYQLCYISIVDRTEEENMKKSLEEVLKENQLKTREEKRLRNERQKKQHKLEVLSTMFIGTFICIVTILLIGYLGKEQTQSINNCMNNGYSYNTCVKGA